MVTRTFPQGSVGSTLSKATLLQLPESVNEQTNKQTNKQTNRGLTFWISTRTRGAGSEMAELDIILILIALLAAVFAALLDLHQLVTGRVGCRGLCRTRR